VSTRNLLARRDRAKRVDQMPTPPVVVRPTGLTRSRVRAGDRLETRRVAHERQRREQLDRQRRIRGRNRLANVVKRHAAAALGQRKVCRRPRGHPSRPRGRVRGFTFAHALDHRKDDGRRDRAAHCADCIAQHNRIVGQHPARGVRQYGQLIVPLPAVLPLPPFLLVPPH